MPGTATLAEAVAKLEADDLISPPSKGRMRYVEQSPFGARAEMDADNTIREVSILRHTSKNNRLYPKSVMEAAIPLFEGAQVFIDHRPEGSKYPQSVRNLAGYIEGVYYNESKQALMARKLHPIGPAANILESCAKTAPKHCGLSIDFDGEGEKTDKGWTKVTLIEAVNSVDLVSKTGSTINLFESVCEPITRPMLEGDVADRVAADEESTKLARIWNAASSQIGRNVYGYDGDLTREKRIAKIIEITTEFIDLITPLRGQEGQGSDKPGNTGTANAGSQTETEMDIKTATLQNLTESRPDLVIQATAAEKARADSAIEKIAGLESKLKTVEASLAEANAKIADAAKRETLSKLAVTVMDAKKVPANLRTTAFTESLIRAGEQAAMEALADDRMIGVTPARPPIDNQEKAVGGTEAVATATGSAEDDQKKIDELLGVNVGK